VTKASVTPDLHQPLDVERNLLTKITLDPALVLDDFTDLPNLFFGQILDTRVGADARRFE